MPGRKSVAGWMVAALIPLLAIACGGSGDSTPTNVSATGAAPTQGGSAGTPPSSATSTRVLGGDAPLVAPQAVRPVIVADNLDMPWGLAFLPDGRVLVSERSGKLQLLAADGKHLGEVKGLPATHQEEQGGMMDIQLSPAFAQDGFLYFTYAESQDGSSSHTAVARAKLELTPTGGSLSGLQVLYRQTPSITGGFQFGARIAFDLNGHMLVSLGDRRHQELSPNLANGLGKIIRLNLDGSVPADNPLVGQPGALPEIWSWGHRDPQGLVFDRDSGLLVESEHGPRGGDELNRIDRGGDYGWPRITSGLDYDTLLPVGNPVPTPDTVAPLKDYAGDTIAPSGTAFYNSDRLKGWRGSMLISGLKSESLVVVRFRNGKVVDERRLLADAGERVRHVVIAPDGLPWVTTDSGRIWRLDPA